MHSTHYKNINCYVPFASFLCSMLCFLGKASDFDFDILKKNFNAARMEVYQTLYEHIGACTGEDYICMH